MIPYDNKEYPKLVVKKIVLYGGIILNIANLNVVTKLL